MPKSKTEKHKVLFKGRFSLRKDQISSDVAFRVMMKCKSKRKSLVKTIMKIHDTGFHIGHDSGLVNIRKMWFYYKDINNYYIFGNDRNALILVNCVQDKYFLSYFYFENLLGMDRICEFIEKAKPMPKISIASEEPLEDFGHISDEPLGIHVDVSDGTLDDHGHISDEPLGNHVDISDGTQDDHGHISDEHVEENGYMTDDEQDGHADLNLSVEDLNEMESIDIFFKPINDCDVSEDFNEPSMDGFIFIDPQLHSQSTFFCRSLRMNNLFNSDYNDLFNGVSDEFEYVLPDENDDRLTHMVGDSMFLYSQKFVPVMDIYGACESDDEEV